MNKIISGLVAGLFAASFAYAQTPAPAQPSTSAKPAVVTPACGRKTRRSRGES